jgi:outer membrane immunogenic protein
LSDAKLYDGSGSIDGDPMKKLLFASCAFVALIATGPVRAADMAVGAPAPAYVPISDWTGFYLGGHAGYGWGHDPFNELLLGNIAGFSGFSTSTVPGAPLNDINSKGALGGGHFGYNQQWGNWVGGLEIDISGTDIKGSTAGADARTIVTAIAGIFPVINVATGTNAATRTDKFEMLASARARLGFLAWPNTLFYGTAGLAWTRFVQSTNETITVGNSNAGLPVVSATTNLAVSNSNSEFGWVAGIGGETKMYNTNWLFRVEYLHYDFGNQGSFSGTTFSTGGGGLASSGARTSGSLTADVVRAGISYKFGGSPI